MNAPGLPRQNPEADRKNGGLPVVSIVTPTYNQADFLAETVECILNQTYPAIEYVVIDDGSTDATQEVLSGFTGRVKWRSQSNRGQSRTLNEAWEEATGTYLTYLSSDDLLHRDAIAKLVAHLEANPEAAAVFPNADLIDATSRVARRRVCRPFDLEALVIEQECYIGPGAVWRRAHHREIGGWRPDLRLSPDRMFWMQMSRFGRIDFLDEVLAGYRIHPLSISYNTVSEEASLEYVRTLDDYFREQAPSAIAARRDEAYARAHLLIARNCYRGGEFARGNHHYALARHLHPPLGSLGTRLRIARNVASKPIRAGLARARRIAGA